MSRDAREQSVDGLAVPDEEPLCDPPREHTAIATPGRPGEFPQPPADGITDAWSGGPWQRISGGSEALADLQRAALDIYGRLDTDRALVWTLEELGELAQAVRRGEGADRLTEELGQLTVWMLCLANILDVDLPVAVRMAVAEEVERQLRKYGSLKPYCAN